MKKALLLLFVTLMALGNVFSQDKVKLGLNFNPGFLLNRMKTQDTSSQWSTSKNGVGFRYTAGVDVHIMFTDNYGLSLGLWYGASRAGVTSKFVGNNGSGVGNISTFKDVYNLQYIMLPATLRMYTNEIATDMKIYFLVGGTFDVLVGHPLHKKSLEPIKSFTPINANLLIGSGVEWKIGSSTYLTGGIRYMRGLIDAVHKTQNGPPNFSLKSDLLSLDIGVKF